jgi:hypothetical protein
MQWSVGASLIASCLLEEYIDSFTHKAKKLLTN